MAAEEVADSCDLMPKNGVGAIPGRRGQPFLVPTTAARRNAVGAGAALWLHHHAPGRFAGRRFVNGAWRDPVRLIEGYMDFAPDEAGVIDGRLIMPPSVLCQSRRRGGEVMLLATEVDGALRSPGNRVEAGAA